MEKDCCASEVQGSGKAWQKALWVALVLNFLMFFVEIIASRKSGSMSLQADALDFLGDSFNYGISLYVAEKVLSKRAKVSFFKGLTMTAFGVFILIETILKIIDGVPPDPPIMGMVGSLAFFANFSVAVLLFKYREGDSNMQSVWLCTRNDAIGNIMVILAAFFVQITATGWPDWIAGLSLAGLGVHSGIKVIALAKKELT